MEVIKVSLLSDGSSDRALIPILKWILALNRNGTSAQLEWADLRGMPRPPKHLQDRIIACIELYPCELLFIHRDAENASYEDRIQEITDALNVAQNRIRLPGVVCIVPIRMQEAWLLFNEAAIRRAAGNPNGRVRLSLPPLVTIEKIRDPKDMLYKLLRKASELRGRRLQKFYPQHEAHRVAEFIDDYSPLLNIPAIRKLREDVSEKFELSG